MNPGVGEPFQRLADHWILILPEKDPDPIGLPANKLLRNSIAPILAFGKTKRLGHLKSTGSGFFFGRWYFAKLATNRKRLADPFVHSNTGGIQVKT